MRWAPPEAPSSWLELGSGTGHLTRLLLARWPECRATITDIAESMLSISRSGLERADRACEWRRLDAAEFDDSWSRLPAPFDLVASNALVQWLPDLDAHLAAVARVLSARGRYLSSGFSADHFPELRGILEQPPFDFPALPGFDRTRLARSAALSGLHLAAEAAEEIRVVYPSVRALLRTLRDMGASRDPSPQRLTPSSLRLLERTYAARHSVEGGVVCTYRPWYALLERSAQSET